MDIDNLSHKELSKSFLQLIEYIRNTLKYKEQKNISKFYGSGLSASKISKLITAGKASNQIGSAKINKNDYQLFKNVLDRFQITYVSNERGEIEFTNGIVANDSNPTTSSFFLTSKGNYWKVFSQIKYANNENVEVNNIYVRYLKIENLAKVRYIVNSKVHSDYIGNGRFSKTGAYLILDLLTENSENKDLHIRFSIADKTSKPEIMMGILVHSHVSENSLTCHAILALNISGTTEIAEPKEISFNDFKKHNKLIAEYFELRCNKITSPYGVSDESSLKVFNLEEADKKKKH
jgi:hypothetical protein